MNPLQSSSPTVAIVGVGSVGMAAAYAMLLKRTASTLLLVDANETRARGEAMDLGHGQALVERVDVRAATMSELAQADVVVVAAGANQKRGQTRLDLLQRNASVITGIVDELDRHAKDAVVIIATNPVDILVQLAVARTSRPKHRMFGSGTTLDTARMRALLGAAHGVSPRSVHAYVLGEHGDSQVALWSSAAVGGTKLASLRSGPAVDDAFRERIASDTKNAAYPIIEAKGYTNLAIGVVLEALVSVILRDQRSVHPVSVPLDGELGLSGVAMSIPCVLGRDGVLGRVVPDVSDAERTALGHSAQVLRSKLEELAQGPGPTP
jgi:L-lactate dehydrogenase